MTDGSFAQGLVGVTLDGRYRLDAVLGEGGMGAVFRATQLALDRKVAVKLLKPHLTSDQGALQRFAREARATFKVDSPHAVKILDFGVTPLGDYYMVLEYLDGRTVHRELEIDGPFAPARVAHIARQALHALGAAHDHGLIHRDVKPDNLLLMRVGSDSDYTKILDFGVAKLVQGASDRSQLALTAAGMVFGTPEFMSPEQACGQVLDGRSDLYSLGATMFVMLTGTALFDGKNALELLTHHARTPAPRLATARPELAAYPELDELLQRCLAKHREERPASAAEMAARLERIEPTLTRSATAPGHVEVGLAPTPPRAFHASSYFHALREGREGREGNDAARPGEATPTTSIAAIVGRPRAVKRRRRGWYLWLAGAVIASVIGIVIGVAIHGSSSRSASITAREVLLGDTQRAAPTPASASVPGNLASASAPGASASAPGASASAPGASASAPGHSASAPAPGAPAPAPAPGASAPAPAPGHSAPAPAPAPGHSASASSAGNPALGHSSPALQRAAAEEHLRNAELAFRANKELKQLAEAHLALRADPRSVRARYLVGDALIKSGDLDRGCTYLRELTQYSPARARARAAGCPGD